MIHPSLHPVRFPFSIATPFAKNPSTSLRPSNLSPPAAVPPRIVVRQVERQLHLGLLFGFRLIRFLGDFLHDGVRIGQFVLGALFDATCRVRRRERGGECQSTFIFLPKMAMVGDMDGIGWRGLEGNYKEKEKGRNVRNWSHA